MAPEPARAQTVIDVGTPTQLVAALTTVDGNPGTSYVINLSASITLDGTTTLPAINSASNVTINGGPGIVLDGGNVQRGFFVYQGTVAINNLTIQNTVAQGGAGGGSGGGGGGAGLGGALFVASGASLSVSNVTLTGNSALGGAGGSSGGFGGGGGGIGGNGGGGGPGAGGGGGLGLGADGGSAIGTGASGIVLGAAGGGGGSGAGGAGGANGGGGGGAGIPGVGGGGGVAGASGNIGGAGGLGGGGGGGTGDNGGAGGLGGGGGASFGKTGGAGGFGGGGGGAGGSPTAVGGLGGFGGGTGGSGTSGPAFGGGGGGLGAGGAIFVQQGGTLTVDGPLTVNGNSVTAGLGGTGLSGGSNGAPGSAVASGMFLQGSGTVTFSPGGSQTQTIDDAIGDEAGNGGTAGNQWALHKTGTGTLILGAANSYTGGTTVDGGTLQLAPGGNLADAGALTVNSGLFDLNNNPQTVSSLSGTGGTIDLCTCSITVDQSTDTSYAGTIIGTGGGGTFIKDGSGKLTLSGTNTYSGGTNLDGGTLSISSDANLGDGGLLQMAAGTTLDVTAGGAYTHDITVEGDPFFNIAAGQTMTQSGLISDGGSAGTIEVTGGGTLKLTNAANSYSGGTTVSDGSTLSISSNGNLGNGGTVSLGDGTGITFTAGGTYSHSITVEGDPAFDVGTGLTVTQSGAIADGATPGEVEKTGGGILVLNAANSYSGGTKVTGGTLSISSDSNLGNGGTVALGDGTTLAFTAGGTYSHAITVAGDPAFDVGTGLTVTQSGAIADGATPGEVEKTGGGVLVLNAANSYSGGTKVTGGTLLMASGASLATTGSLTVNGGSFDLNGNTQTVGTLSGTGGGIELGSGGALTVTQGTAATYAGVIAGNGSLTKTGLATLTLTGTNTYQGGTTVSAGTLAGTTNSLQGDILVASGANVSFDQALGTEAGYGGQLSGAGSLTKTGAGMLFLTNTNTYSGGTVVTDGGISISSDANLGNGGTVALEAGTTLQFTGSGTYNHAITVAGDPTFSLISSLTVTQSGAIADGATPGTVEVAGGGTLVLTNTLNSYSGGTVVTGGSTVSIADDHVLGASGGGLTLGDGASSGKLAITDSLASARAITLAAGGGTIALDAGVAATLEGNITGAGGLTKAGDGTLLLAGVNDYTGGTTIAAGTLQGNTTSLQGDVDMTGTANLVFDQDSTGTFAGDISGGRGSLTKLGTGTLILTGSNSYGFGTTVSGGILQGNTASLQGFIVDDANVTFDQAADGTYSGNISGSGSLTKIGAGTLIFNSNNIYTGGTTIEAGMLQLGDNLNQPSFAGPIVVNGSGGLTVANALTSGITTITANDQAAIRFIGNTTASSAVIVTNGSAITTFAEGSRAGAAHLTTNDSGKLRFRDSALADSAVIVTNDSAVTTFAESSNAGSARITTNDSAATLFVGSSSAAEATIITNDNAKVQFQQASTAGLADILNNKGSLNFFDTSTANEAIITNQNGGRTDFLDTSTAASSIITSSSNGRLTFFDGSTADHASITNGSGGTTAFIDTSTAASAIIINSGSLVFSNSSTAGSARISDNGSAVFKNNSTAGSAELVTLGDATLTFQDQATAGSASLNTHSGGTTRFQDSSSAGTASIVTTGTTIFTGSSSAASATIVTNDGGSTAFTGSASGGDVQFVTNAGGTVVFGGLTTSGTTAGSIAGAGGYRLGAEQLTVGSNNLSTEVSGAISGNGGSLVKVGTGTLTLSGANSYGGGTTVEGGILRLETGGSLAATGALIVNAGTFNLNGINQTVSALSGSGGTIALDSGTLTVKQSITTSFLGDISGTGGLTKAGPGTLILNGANDYTGVTSVNAGILEIGDADHPEASIGGPVTVGSDGKLEGHGTIGGDVANSDGGVLSPGGSIGTLTVGGNYNQGSSSRLLIEVSPTAASKLKVIGNASLAGNLALVYDPGVYSASSYDILNAASVTGTFGSVTGQAPDGFTQSVTYSPTDVILGLTSGGGPVIVTPTNDTIYTALSTAALLAAQQANTALLTHMGELHLGTGSPSVQTALASTAPTQVAFAGTADQLADLLPEIPQAVGQMGGWFKAIGSFASLDGSMSTPGFDTQAGGFLAGFDKAFSPNLTGGIALGYLHTNLSEAGGASGSIDTPRLAVYGSYTFGNFAIDATAGYAYDFIDASRPFANLGETASSSYNGQEANAAIQLSTRAAFGGITFMPAAGLAFVHVAQTGVGESGAPGFNLSVNGNSANSLRPFVGLTAAKSYTTNSGMVVTPEADIAYSYETLATTPPSLIQVGGGSFTVPGLMPSRSQLTVGGGITAQLTDALAFEAAYHITPPTGNLLSQTISLGLDYRF